MNRLLIVAIILSVSSCKDKRLYPYEQLIDRTEKIVVHSREHPDSFVIIAASTLGNMKRILKRNIRPVSPRKFIVERSISLYAAGKRIGVLMVSYGKQPYINFCSDSLNFTFPLTYGIGMSLDNLAVGDSR